MRGTVMTGDGDATEFVSLITDLVAEELDFRPYPGTLNIANWFEIDRLPTVTVADGSLGTDNCNGVEFRPCSVNGVCAAIVEPLVDGYPNEKCELLAPIHLRSLFNLVDGDTVHISKPPGRGTSHAVDTDARELAAFDAVVFDVDPTLDKADDRTAADGMAGVLIRLLRTVADLNCRLGVCIASDQSEVKSLLEGWDLERSAVTVLDADPRLQSDSLRRFIGDLNAPPGNVVFVGADPINYSIAHEARVSYLQLAQLSTPR